MDQNETWYGSRPWPQPHCLRWDPAAQLPKKEGAQPQFSAYVYSGQNCLSWGTSSSTPGKKNGHSSKFSAYVYSGQTARWMKTPLITEVDLGLVHTVLDGDPAPPPRKGHSAPRSFRSLSVVAAEAHLAATAELLFITSYLWLC